MSDTYNEDRLQILRMVEENKISAKEAISLLSALENPTARTSNAAAASSAPAAETAAPTPAPAPFQAKINSGNWRFFRVRVTDTKSGRSKAQVTIPMSLMEWGLKIGAQFSPEVGKLKVEDFNSLMEAGVDGLLVDVIDEEDGEHVEVFVE